MNLSTTSVICRPLSSDGSYIVLPTVDGLENSMLHDSNWISGRQLHGNS